MSTLLIPVHIRPLRLTVTVDVVSIPAFAIYICTGSLRGASMMSVRKVAEYFLAKATIRSATASPTSSSRSSSTTRRATTWRCMAGRCSASASRRASTGRRRPAVPPVPRVRRGQHPLPGRLRPGRLRCRLGPLLDEVYDVFGQYSARKLRNMTHAGRSGAAASGGGRRAQPARTEPRHPLVRVARRLPLAIWSAVMRFASSRRARNGATAGACAPLSE